MRPRCCGTNLLTPTLFPDFKEKSLSNNSFSSKTKYSAGFHYRQEQILPWLNEKLHKLQLHLHLLLLGREKKTPTQTSPLQFWCSSPAVRHSPAQRGAAKAEAQEEDGDGCHTLRPPSPLLLPKAKPAHRSMGLPWDALLMRIRPAPRPMGKPLERKGHQLHHLQRDATAGN